MVVEIRKPVVFGLYQGGRLLRQGFRCFVVVVLTSNCGDAGGASSTHAHTENEKAAKSLCRSFATWGNRVPEKGCEVAPPSLGPVCYTCGQPTRWSAGECPLHLPGAGGRDIWERTMIRAFDVTDVESQQEVKLSDADSQYLAEFERMLDLIRDRTRSVAERYQVGAYLVGRAGSSKTYTVIETLKGLGVPWAYRNSRMSPLGLYAFLEEHPEHTCVIDDIPALLDQRQSLQILMAALGGEPGKPRPVTYTTKSKSDRKSFEFAGGIIAISNLPLRRDPLADAVASRVAVLEHEPSDEMIAAFMRREALKGYEDMSPTACMEVVEFVIKEAQASDYAPGSAPHEEGVAGLSLAQARQGLKALGGFGPVQHEADLQERPDGTDPPR